MPIVFSLNHRQIIVGNHQSPSVLQDTRIAKGQLLNCQERLALLLLLNRLNGVGDGLRNGLDLGSLREVLGLDDGLGVGIALDNRRDELSLGRLGRSRATANVLLGLGAVVTNVLLHQTGSVGGVLAGHVLQLVGLRADDSLEVCDLLIDDLAVADVHKRAEVGGGDGDHSKSPDRNEADQPVASEGSGESLKFVRIFSLSVRREGLAMTYSNGVNDILGEQNTLELNQEEIEQLGDVLEHSLMGFLGDGIVATGAE